MLDFYGLLGDAVKHLMPDVPLQQAKSVLVGFIG